MRFSVALDSPSDSIESIVFTCLLTSERLRASVFTANELTCVLSLISMPVKSQSSSFGILSIGIRVLVDSMLNNIAFNMQFITFFKYLSIQTQLLRCLNLFGTTKHWTNTENDANDCLDVVEITFATLTLELSNFCSFHLFCLLPVRCLSNVVRLTACSHGLFSLMRFCVWFKINDEYLKRHESFVDFWQFSYAFLMVFCGGKLKFPKQTQKTKKTMNKSASKQTAFNKCVTCFPILTL